MTTARRCLMFATVITACAGIGFFASHLWPLPASLTPSLKVASSDATGLNEQQRPDRSSYLRAQPPLKHEATQATESPRHASLVLLNPGAAEQSREAEATIQRPTGRDIDEPAAEPTRTVRQPPEKRTQPRQSAPRQEKHVPQAKLPQPSTNSIGFQRDAAMRDFMSHNPPFRY